MFNNIFVLHLLLPNIDAMKNLMSLTRSLTSNLLLKKLAQHTLVQTFCLSWFITLATQIKVPFYPVPMIMHDWAIMLVALLAARRVALGAVLLFLSYPVMGIPVFDVSGLALFLDPTAGYLVGFVLMTAIITTLKDRYSNGSFGVNLGIVMIGNVVLFAAGLSWLAYLMGWHIAIKVGLLPFVWINITKVLSAASVATYWRRA